MTKGKVRSVPQITRGDSRECVRSAGGALLEHPPRGFSGQASHDHGEGKGGGRIGVRHVGRKIEEDRLLRRMNETVEVFISFLLCFEAMACSAAYEP